MPKGATANLLPLLGVWEELRGVTLSGLEQLLHDGQNPEFPRPGLDTSIKQFQEMLAVESAYVDSLESGAVDLSSVPDVKDFDGDDSLEALKQRADSASIRLRTLIESGRVPPTITWGGYGMPTVQVLSYMIAHETFHQGQIAAFLYAAGQEPPAAWRQQWAMPTRR